MRKYVLTSKGFTGELIFGYNSEDILVLFENKAELEDEHLKFLTSHFPFVKDELTKIVKNGKVTEITDLSFNRFWEDYDNKAGNKKQAEKLWVNLYESTRIAIFEHLPKYNYYLKTHQGLMKAYPTTFLNQTRWENEYK